MNDKSSKTYVDYMKDMLETMEFMQRIFVNVDFETLSGDDLIAKEFILERAFEVIGEAAKKIPENIRLKYPDVAWKKMAGLRDIVIHTYDIVDPEILIEVMNKNIPHDIIALKKIISQEELESNDR